MMLLTKVDGAIASPNWIISKYRPLEYYLQFLLPGEVLEISGTRYGASSLLASAWKEAVK